MHNHHENDRTFVDEATGVSNPLALAIGYLMSAGLWIGLAWAVYFWVPKFRRLLEDFGTEMAPRTSLILKYAPWAFPLIVIFAASSFALNRSRKVRTFVLFLLPGALVIGLVLLVGPQVLDLVENLS